MHIIQDPSVSQRLRKQYDIKGPNPSPVLNPDVQPVVIVDDLTHKGSDRSLVQRHCHGSDNFIAGVNLPCVGLRVLGAAAQVQARITHLSAHSPTSDQVVGYRVAAGTPGLTAVDADHRDFMDVGRAATEKPIAEIVTADFASVTEFVFCGRMASGTWSWRNDVGILIRPGQCWLMQSLGFATQLAAYFEWIEEPVRR